MVEHLTARALQGGTHDRLCSTGYFVLHVRSFRWLQRSVELLLAGSHKLPTFMDTLSQNQTLSWSILLLGGRIFFSTRSGVHAGHGVTCMRVLRASTRTFTLQMLSVRRQRRQRPGDAPFSPRPHSMNLCTTYDMI